MVKKYYKSILLLLGAFLAKSLYATNSFEQNERKNDTAETLSKQKALLRYYNYTLQYSQKKIDNRVDPEKLAKEQQNLIENHVAEKLKNRKGTTFFMVIVSHKQTQALSKFFFFNRDPSKEQDAIKRVHEFYRCHVVSHTKPMLSPHIIFQLMGWIAQGSRTYTPIFMHANRPLCFICHAIVYNLFKLEMPTNQKGCRGDSNIALETACPLAKRYIQKSITLTPALSQKILLRASEKMEKQIKELTKKFSDQARVLYDFVKDRIELPYSPLNSQNLVLSVAISSDNRYIVSGGRDKVIRIWDFTTGKEVSYSPLNRHKNAVLSVAISSDNRYIVSGSADNTIRIWNLKTGKEVDYSPLEVENTVLSMAISSDNRYIVSGSAVHETICIWDFNTGKEVNYSPLKRDNNMVVLSVAITKDNKYIVSGSYQFIRIWDLKTGEEVSYSPLKGHTDGVYSVATTNDNKYIVSSSSRYMNKTIRIWDLKTGKEVSYSPLKGHNHGDSSVAISSDNTYIVSFSMGGIIHIWDLKTGKELSYRPIYGHTSKVTSVVISSDNRYIVSGSGDKTIRIWDFKLLRDLNKAAHKAAADKEDNNADNNAVFDID